jgi:tRNA-Thr(GGU) m(6)t(6)A37 methyltransferase TsaA
MAKKGKTMTQAQTFSVHPVGYVRRQDKRVYLEILEPYVPAMKDLQGFSHVQVFWWFTEFDDEMYRQVLQSDPPYEAPTLGVFSCRSPVRSNPIALTTARMLGVDHDKGEVDLVNIDAFDGTPVLDLKAYIPVCDRVEDVGVPNWASSWPEWLPEEGLGPEG